VGPREKTCPHMMGAGKGISGFSELQSAGKKKKLPKLINMVRQGRQKSEFNLGEKRKKAMLEGKWAAAGKKDHEIIDEKTRTKKKERVDDARGRK